VAEKTEKENDGDGRVFTDFEYKLKQHSFFIQGINREVPTKLAEIQLEYILGVLLTRSDFN